MPRETARPSGGLEAEIIACLAARDEGMTPAEVRDEIGTDLAYTTVMTALSRLYAKQALTRTPRGRAYAYSLAGGSDGAHASMTAHQMQKLLAGESNRASVLSRFVDGLDGDSEQILRTLLAGDPASDDGPAPDDAAGTGKAAGTGAARPRRRGRRS